MNLNNKHTIFGHIVGGLNTLDEINKIGCDAKEKPTKEIKIIRIDVYYNPFREVISEMLLKEFKEKYGLVEQRNYEKDQILQEKINKLLPNSTGDADDINIGKYLGKKRLNDNNQRMIQKLKEKEEQSTFDKPKQDKELFKDW